MFPLTNWPDRLILMTRVFLYLYLFPYMETFLRVFYILLVRGNMSTIFM